MDDLKELRRLADAAKGWAINTFKSATRDDLCVFGREDEGEFYEVGTLDCENYGSSSDPLAQYLVATRPGSILSLLDRLEVLQAENEALRLQVSQAGQKAEICTVSETMASDYCFSGKDPAAVRSSGEIARRL